MICGYLLLIIVFGSVKYFHFLSTILNNSQCLCAGYGQGRSKLKKTLGGGRALGANSMIHWASKEKS